VHRTCINKIIIAEVRSNLLALHFFRSRPCAAASQIVWNCSDTSGVIPNRIELPEAAFFRFVTPLYGSATAGAVRTLSPLPRGLKNFRCLCLPPGEPEPRLRLSLPRLALSVLTGAKSDGQLPKDSCEMKRTLNFAILPSIVNMSEAIFLYSCVWHFRSGRSQLAIQGQADGFPAASETSPK
jgi:hypothetical protein